VTEANKQTQTEQSLREMARFAELNPGPVISVDTRGEILTSNRAAREILGDTAVPGTRLDSLLPGLEDIDLAACIRHGQVVEHEEVVGRRHFQFVLRGVPELDISHIYGSDFTRRRRVERLLEQANEQLRRQAATLQEKQTQLIQAEKMAALGGLVAGVAHEINTPLAALRSNSELFDGLFARVRTQVTPPDPAIADRTHGIERLLSRIEQLNAVNRTAMKRVSVIVKSLRTFARLDQAERAQADIHEGLESTLTLVHHRFKNRIRVHKDYGQLPPVSCFPNQLNQVFMNLLVNAGQAIDEEGDVFISTRRRRDDVVVEFRDTGRGIPSDVLSRIFDPGFTTKGTGVGTGLGLSIVFQILQDHHGHIEVDSTVGLGTTFRITLPIDTARNGA
jgi:signal transduction histidine kinase